MKGRVTFTVEMPGCMLRFEVTEPEDIALLQLLVERVRQYFEERASAAHPEEPGKEK